MTAHVSGAGKPDEANPATAAALKVPLTVIPFGRLADEGDAALELSHEIGGRAAKAGLLRVRYLALALRLSDGIAQLLAGSSSARWVSSICA